MIYAKLLLLALPAARAVGSANCPCLTAYPSGVSPPDGVKVGGKTFLYPSGYGLNACTRHDVGLAPYCSTTGSGMAPPS